jgi:energy-converting hydrogenase A subunit M
MWKKISTSNQMNKINRLVNVEQKHLELKRDLINKLSKVLSIDEDKYDLKEGISEVGEGLQEVEKAQQTIYKNFINAVNKSKLSVEDFFEKTKFWETILGKGA